MSALLKLFCPSAYPDPKAHLLQQVVSRPAASKSFTLTLRCPMLGFGYPLHRRFFNLRTLEILFQTSTLLGFSLQSFSPLG
jgi:hypothetical protein